MIRSNPSAFTADLVLCGRNGLTVMITCSVNDCEKPVDRDDVCFRHRVAGIGFNWKGGGMTYGRANFSKQTNKEFVANTVGMKNIRNGNAQKKSTRKELI